MEMSGLGENRRHLNAAEWRSIIARVPLLFEVTSNSMAPTFFTGERVSIRPLKENEPRRGQVVAYFRGMLVTHRYVGAGICIGDNMLARDPRIETEDMVGIVDGVQRNGRVIPLGRRMTLRTRIHRVRLWIGRWISRIVRGCSVD